MPDPQDGTAWQFYEVGADFLFHSGYDRDQPKGNRPIKGDRGEAGAVACLT